jgi:hypothetical protein
MITKEQVLNLIPGQSIIDAKGKKWRINGKVETSETNLEYFKIPIKYGFVCSFHGYLTNNNNDLFRLPIYPILEDESNV